MNIGMPIFAKAENLRFLMEIPNDEGGQACLWAADVKLSGHIGSLFFEDIVFLENGNFVSICGIESEDGRPQHLSEEVSDSQQGFISTLRSLSKHETEMLGALAAAFDGYGFMAEGKVTAAYISARKAPLCMGIGRTDPASGKYELFGIDPVESGWLYADVMNDGAPAND